METAIPKGWKLADPNSDMLSLHGQTEFTVFGGNPAKPVSYMTYHWRNGVVFGVEHEVSHVA